MEAGELPNDDLKLFRETWEEVEGLRFGFDFGFGSDSQALEIRGNGEIFV